MLLTELAMDRRGRLVWKVHSPSEEESPIIEQDGEEIVDPAFADYIAPGIRWLEDRGGGSLVIAGPFGQSG